MKFIFLILAIAASSYAVPIQKFIPDQPSIAAPEIKIAFSNGAERTVEGQVFIRTKGGDTKKMSGITVFLYPKAAIDQYKQWVKTQALRRFNYYATRVSNLQNAGKLDEASFDIGHMKMCLVDDWNYLPNTPYSAQTDADGKFSLKFSAQGELMIFAKTGRQTGEDFEHYEWAVAVPKDGPVFLSNRNLIGE